jgi:hypothetical protein
LARALAATGQTAAAKIELDRARELTERVAEEGDRKVLYDELPKEPWFGLTS